MRLRLPKGNIEWTVEGLGEDPRSYRMVSRGPTLTGTVRTPDGNQFGHTVAIHFAHNASQEYADAVVEQVVEGLSRAVGRYIVTGKKP